MKNVLTVALAALLTATIAGPTLHAAPLGAQAAAGTVKVTITYKGKGKVDATHKLWVYLFDNPNIGPGSQPIGQVAIDKNGSDAVFDGIAGDKVFVAVAFDEQGVMQGDAPPPTGSPISILSGADGMPMSITPGPKGLAKLAFDDTVRMP
jgi:hypothetical protein